MSEINRGLDHMANLQRGWSPGRAVLPPDPGHHNRMLDRAAAEHLRAVAPGLAPPGPRDWPEDRAHENGNYWNECGTCHGMFIGHKRRVTCRECHRDVKPENATAPPHPEPEFRPFGYAAPHAHPETRASLAPAPAPAPAAEADGRQGPCDCGQNACHECRARINPAPPQPWPDAARWRKRPVVVDAVQVTAEWFDGDHPNPLHPVGVVMDPVRRVVEIPTLEGVMTGNVGDWIITGVRGEKYPCKPDIFTATYEPVTPAPAPPAEAKHHEEDCVCRECRPEMHSAQPPAEAKGEEMTAVGLRIALDAFYRQGYYAGMADMSGNREMVQEHADRAEVAVKPVLDAFAALRTRAREAEERAEKTTEHLLNSVAKAVRRGDELESERDEARQEARWLAEVFIATGHATPDIHAWLDRAKHCVGTLRESLTAANERVDALLLERDEAREQREDLANEILAERSDLAAANARAEEAERKALMAGQDKVAAQRRADSSHRLMENERAARLKAEKEMNLLIGRDVPRLEERLAAAEAEVKRLTELSPPHTVALRLNEINEAFDGPIPTAWPKDVTGSVVSRIAALRASVARLVEAGDEARDILNAILDNQYTYRERVDAVDRWVARWAAAKAGRALDAPAGSEAKR